MIFFRRSQENCFTCDFNRIIRVRGQWSLKFLSPDLQPPSTHNATHCQTKRTTAGAARQETAANREPPHRAGNHLPTAPPRRTDRGSWKESAVDAREGRDEPRSVRSPPWAESPENKVMRRRARSKCQRCHTSTLRPEKRNEIKSVKWTELQRR